MKFTEAESNMIGLICEYQQFQEGSSNECICIEEGYEYEE